MLDDRRVVFYDIEADELYMKAKNVWVVHMEDNRGASLTLRPFTMKAADVKRKIVDFFFREENPIVVGHNILGYDMWMLWKHFDIAFRVGPSHIDGKPCDFFDTLYASRFLSPDQEQHSLAYWGERLGNQKIDFHEFSQWSQEMEDYCIQDVSVLRSIYRVLSNEMQDIYSDLYPSCWKAEQKNQYLMDAQAYTGFAFDREAAELLVPKLEEHMERLRSEVEPQLPPREPNAGEAKQFTMPAKPFKKDGTFSSHMLNFLEKHGITEYDEEEKVIVLNSVQYPVQGGYVLPIKVPMLISNTDALKDYLISQGWSPTLWNFKKDARGKPIRENGKLVQTSPKIQEAGKICPNLEAMELDIPRKVCTYLSLRNRLAVLQGWLQDERLAFDGRLSTSYTGITPTYRMKHSNVVNVPKAQDGVLYGKEFRSLFVAQEGNVIAAADAASLENRVGGHYVFRYDNGEYADLVLNGDSHSFNAKIFFKEETEGFDITSPDFDKDDPKFKPYRSKAKNGIYALLYGCSPPKLAKTLGKPESAGQELYDNFWKESVGLGLFREALLKYWEGHGQKKFVAGIDGRRIYTRSKHAVINSLWQSCGAIIMSYACCLMDAKLGGLVLDNLGRPCYNYRNTVVKRVGYFHDELEFECSPDVAEEIGQMIVDSIVKAGQMLKLKVELAGEAKIGANWKETH